MCRNSSKSLPYVLRFDTRGRQFAKKLRDAVQSCLMPKKEEALSIPRAAHKLGVPRSTLHGAIQRSKKPISEIRRSD